MATRKFKFSFAACAIFLLDSTDYLDLGEILFFPCFILQEKANKYHLYSRLIKNCARFIQNKLSQPRKMSVYLHVVKVV